VPLFDFICNGCGYKFESLSNFSASCPNCGSQSVIKKIVNRFGIALKGDGWAKDGYATKKENPKSEDG